MWKCGLVCLILYNYLCDCFSNPTRQTKVENSFVVILLPRFFLSVSFFSFLYSYVLKDCVHAYIVHTRQYRFHFTICFFLLCGTPSLAVVAVRYMRWKSFHNSHGTSFYLHRVYTSIHTYDDDHDDEDDFSS